MINSNQDASDYADQDAQTFCIRKACSSVKTAQNTMVSEAVMWFQISNNALDELYCRIISKL